MAPRLLATYLLACIASGVQATGPLITQVSPSTGGLYGGTRVTILGAGFSVGPMVRREGRAVG